MKVTLFIVLAFIGQQRHQPPLMEEMPSLEECLLNVHDALHDKEINKALQEIGGAIQASCVVELTPEPKT